MREQQAANQNDPKTQDREETDAIEKQGDYQQVVASPEERLRSVIMAAEQRLKRLETLLRRTSSHKGGKARLKMLQTSVEEQRQEIAQLKAAEAEARQGIVKTKDTRYRVSRPRYGISIPDRKKESKTDLVDDLTKLKRWLNDL